MMESVQSWSPTGGPQEVRSPCPFLNALANHSILPHDGKGIDEAMIVKALTETINFDATLAKRFFSVALFASPIVGATKLDLDQLAKHGVIEHDVSLSRNDFSLGDNNSFDADVWQTFTDQFESEDTIDVPTVSNARWHRLLACSEDHVRQGIKLQYGVKEMLFGYGESALYLAVFGDAEKGEIPTKYLRTLVEKERLPYEQGWEKSETPITQMILNGLLFKLFMANKNKLTEVLMLGTGTIRGAVFAMRDLVGNLCTVM